MRITGPTIWLLLEESPMYATAATKSTSAAPAATARIDHRPRMKPAAVTTEVMSAEARAVREPVAQTASHNTAMRPVPTRRGEPGRRLLRSAQPPIQQAAMAPATLPSRTVPDALPSAAYTVGLR